MTIYDNLLIVFDIHTVENSTKSIFYFLGVGVVIIHQIMPNEKNVTHRELSLESVSISLLSAHLFGLMAHNFIILIHFHLTQFPATTGTSFQ